MEKHPHVRGEDFLLVVWLLKQVETPPRAWGRRTNPQEAHLDGGNTPTCVGKTDIQGRSDHLEWKHPHVRGEDQNSDFF